MVDHLFQCRPFQIFGRIVELVVIHMDHIFVFLRSFWEEQASNLPMNVEGAVVTRSMQVQRFLTGGKAAIQQFTIR